MVLDISLSMPMRGYWLSALGDATALVKELQDPQTPDQLKAIVAFGEQARTIEPAGLATMEWDVAFGSNLAAALHLALAQLGGEPGRIVIFSDMDPNAHTRDDGEVFYSFPAGREIAEATVQSVKDCIAGGAQLEVRRYRAEEDAAAGGGVHARALLDEVSRLGGAASEVIVPSP